jgi:protein phosphatase
VIGKDKIEHANLSDVGMRRSQNQDSFNVLLATNAEQWQKQGHVFIVADGMGAHAVGELASELAANIIPLTFTKYAAEGPVSALEKAFQEANSSIHNRGQQNRDFQGMGTTSSVLLLRKEGAWVGHVGDSRVYRIREGQVEQLSFDHSLLWEIARRQKVRPDQITGVPTNVIVRSLGPEGNVNVDVEGPHQVRKGDTYLLCSDGLSGQVSAKEIGAIASNLPPEEACQLLVDLANLAGGPDNITVIIVRSHVDFGDENPSDGKDHTETGPPWYQRIPWPYSVLGAGALLALLAIGLTVGQVAGGAMVFLLAAGCMIAGVAGLVMRILNEPDEKPAEKPAWKPRRKVYSHAPCKVEQALLDKIAQAIGILEQRIRDKVWDCDWETYAEHQQKTEGHVKKGDLTAAFREQCRSLSVLTDVLRQHRPKEEEFEALWDKVEE